MQRRGQLRHGVQQVLAVVEHDQHPTRAQRLRQGRDLRFGAELDTQHTGHCGCNNRRVGKRRQFDEPHAVVIGSAQPVGERLRQRRLADAAAADDGHKLVQLDKGAQRQQILGAAIQRWQLGR